MTQAKSGQISCINGKGIEPMQRPTQKTVATIAAGLAALTLANPAFADDDRRDRHGRHEWKDNRSESKAYAKGYRQGVRADDRRDDRRAYAQGYRDGVRADNRRDNYRDNYRTDYRYASNGWNSAPVYSGNSGWRGVSQQNPYWWGSNGQMHCRRQDGTTGLLVGALAGGTLGNMLAREGDKRLGSVIGGTLGAVLGNELAKGNVRCR